MHQVISGPRRRIRRFADFVLETHGRSMGTTAKIAFNKLFYLIQRATGRTSRKGLVHAEWHWARYPFSLRRRVLWSSPLQAWFFAEDESAIECMLHMPAYEPIEWVNPSEGEYFLDGGGYVGWYSIQAGRAVGTSGRVVSLEPDRVNRSQLERNLALNKLENVQILPLAVWSRSGSVGWRQGEEPVWHQVRDGSGETQKATSIDELVHDLQLARLDWIKLDIEGAEVNALQGAVRTLRDFSPKLFIEVHETTTAVARLLCESGYRIVRELYDQPPDRHGWILAQRT
jgi:FkbM family methyltransferase